MAELNSTLIKGCLNTNGAILENGKRVYSPNNPQEKVDLSANAEKLNGHEDTYFAKSDHNHDSNYLKLSGGTVTGELKLIEPNKLLFNMDAGEYLAPDNSTVVGSVFSSNVWHDHFAFLKCHSIDSQEKTTDGTSWAATDYALKKLFDQKDDSFVMIMGSTDKAFRFTLSCTDIGYSGIYWYEISTSTSSNGNVKITVEYSTDKNSWTKCNEFTKNYSSSLSPVFIRNFVSFTKNGYLRFTFTKAEDKSMTVSCANIRGLTSRKGHQGKGNQYELPYSWSENQDMQANNNFNTTGYLSEKGQRVYSPNNPQQDVEKLGGIEADNYAKKTDIPEWAKSTTKPEYTLNEINPTDKMVCTWANDNIKDLSIAGGADFSTNSGEDKNFVICGTQSNVNLVVDGDMYCNEGQNKVYNEGNLKFEFENGVLTIIKS